MAREWQVQCKWPGCTNKVGYSDRSYRNSLAYGFSRPEYCEEHQQEEQKMRKGVATPYFRIPQFIGEIEPGHLGNIKRSGKRVHISTDKESKFDKSRFGVTEEDIYKIAAWFKDPNHRVLVATGATGAGKTIAVPYWFLYPPKNVADDFGSDYFTRDGQILLTEPRIIALKKSNSILRRIDGFINWERSRSWLFIQSRRQVGLAKCNRFHN